MDLTTKYLGLTLPHPVVSSAAQPLTKDLDSLKMLEDGGAAAIVMHSLFEEQIEVEAQNLEHYLSHGEESFAEALSYFPAQEEYVLGPEEYLEHVRRAKESLSVPVVGSLNGVSVGGWTRYAKLIEEAGADALELNIYYMPTDPTLSSETVENVYISVLEEVRARVSIPVALKTGAFFSSLAHFAKRVEAAGAAGMTMFNRFYQPDIDIEELSVAHTLNLSTSAEALLPLRWLAILRPHVAMTLAATTGVHSETDALKLIMAGADVTMMCSELLQHGTHRLREVREGIERWLTEHEYESLDGLAAA